MSLDPSVREELTRLLEGQAGLNDFRQTFRPLAWRLGDVETRVESPLTRRVALLVSEFNLGHRTEPELRELFEEALRTVEAGFGAPQPRWTASTGATRSGLFPSLVGAGTGV
jgi:hypothetical protein